MTSPRAKRPNGVPRVGLLSLQGDFERHRDAVATLGAEPVRISLPEHVHALDAMILPGGESSTMLRLLDSTGLRPGVEAFVRRKPVLGTCAGLILLSRSADKLPAPPFGVLDIGAARNAYGRQVHSFTDDVHVGPLNADVPGVFIRAPRITRVGKGVEVIATWRGEPVGVRQGQAVAIAFHPELTGDTRLHAWFLRDVAKLPLPGAAR
ncbi:MAG: pyridoxal 5'-phosphate synthase glutaminase subunit PdxT [Candidatus Eisenbacteria bacterium]